MRLVGIVVIVSLLKHAGAKCYDSTSFPSCDNIITCGGSCIDDNGCFCNDDTTLCVPTECLIKPTLCCPPGLFWDDVNYCCSEVLVCSPPCLDDENCVNINNISTCECNTTYYKKNTTKADIKPLIDCSGGVMTFSIGRCLLNFLGYNYKTVQVQNKSEQCNSTYSQVINGHRVQSLQLRAQSQFCGNKMTMDSSKIYYSNTIYIDILQKPIISVTPIEMNFTCSYALNMQANISFGVLQSITYLTPVNGQGLYPLTMKAFKDAKMAIPFQPNDNVIVGDDVFLSLIVGNADGAQFALRTVKCIATPTNSIIDPNGVLLVTGGCSADDGVETEILENGKSVESRIRISSFQFDGYLEVFIFCEARLCENPADCTGCKEGRAAEPGSGQVMIPLSLEDSINFSNSGSNAALSWTVLAGCFLLYNTFY
ncbi:pancreatic secretory granule membrane major glycoprotein GP2-like [Bombina bombina]|uniref:pancreatic secretory granule membrane major glycoprotein GP2-like n=1 Tax=Bombina bombina TaxID=8345 RepID=UPI00235B1122|nr:pancreatic secretory granule membrane major glycoprotein GP2-like [Bombina bombina]